MTRATSVILRLREKFARIRLAYARARDVAKRLAKANAKLKRKYFLLKKHSTRRVAELVDRINRERYQLVFDEDRKLVSVSDAFLAEIGMERDEFARSFYVDVLFERFLPPPDRKALFTEVAAFNFPVLIEGHAKDGGLMHPFIHLRISGKASFDPGANRYRYSLNAVDVTGSVELGYYQKTNTLIESLSIANLNLLKARKAIEAHKTMLISLVCSLVGEYSKETAWHLRNLQQLTTFLSAECKRMGLIRPKGYDPEEYMKDINYTSILHDIGKMGIPASLIEKETGLTDEEFALMRRHPEIGANYVRRIIGIFEDDPVYSSYVDFLRIPYAICRHHHERWDGSGYPDGLSGEDIPIAARIVAVADAYEAIRGKRAYTRVQKGHKEALDAIAAEAGKQFDPRVVEAFLNVDYRFADLF
jgi:HD-GYP domain-containing protein (c-di-GMP phosphodiesterase class II)